MEDKTASAITPWDSAYEFKTVLLMSLGFGLVGLDRWIIADLAGFSTMVPDLGLNVASVGTLISALGLVWGVSALFLGTLADVIGRRKILIPALILFSLLSGVSGLATGFAFMLVTRMAMGVAEGAYCPTSFATIAEASKPSRRGFNLGLLGGSFSLAGLGFAPIIASQLLAMGLSWRWVFGIVGIPGLIVALLVALTIREPATIKASARVSHRPTLAMFQHRNVPLGMLALICAMCGIFVLSAFVPIYLTTYLHLETRTAGVIAGAIGFGGFAGSWILSALSDFFGRRAMAVAGFLFGAAFLYIFMRLDASNPALLFSVLFIISGAALGLLCLVTGPVASEAAPLGAVAGTTGVVVAAGEIFGGGIAPGLGGYIAQNFGIQSTLWLALAGLVAGFVVSLFLTETAPRFTQNKQGGESDLDRYEEDYQRMV